MYQPKLFASLKNYNKKSLISDVTAGVIVGIIALPLSIALAIASGVSPQVGLHTAIIAGFCISFFGGSRVQIGGPTGAFVVVVYSVIAKFGISGLILAGIMAGIMLVVMGACRLGTFIKFIPFPITAGFTNGIAVVIFLTQIKDLLGLSISSVPSEAAEKLLCYVKNICTVNVCSIIISTVAVAIIILWPKLNKKLPGSLIAIVVTTLIVNILHINVSTIGMTYGEIPSSLPKFSFPAFNIGMMIKMLPSAFTISFLAAIESLLSAVVSDKMIDDETDANAELIGQGIANIMSGLFGAIPATGAIARTAANVKNGANTPIAGIVHALTLLVILLVLMPLAKYIPLASLGAVLAVVAFNMGEWDVFEHLFKKKNKTQFLTMLLTFILTIFTDLVVAIAIGAVIYIIGCSIVVFKRKRRLAV
ncbi:MAG: SulP family inorganic anion transporter [Clostridia bacterium]|nr:SulP family inorganic anion transporter [Clostridia bacterium]